MKVNRNKTEYMYVNEEVDRGEARMQGLEVTKTKDQRWGLQQRGEEESAEWNERIKKKMSGDL